MGFLLLALSFLGCEEDRAELAREEKLGGLRLALQALGVNPDGPFELFFRAFKVERILEIWVKNRVESNFVLLKSYPVCSISGSLGPKRKEGDQQVPEGIYHISRFNPKSKFHLSLGLNYPNEADKLLADPVHPGSDIFIHGGCASVGCLAMTDDQIKEIYVLAELARESGQERIPVHIFPTKMTGENLEWLVANKTEQQAFWKELMPAYHYFEEKRQLPVVTISVSGAYSLVEKDSGV
ncbi:MAG: L,D-transpeptidase family protein [Saprospiraceae bacterium]|nr:L,D-transpeptidase family protein [Saprospiraceae bacterium]